MKQLLRCILLVLVIALLCGARCNRPAKVTVPSKPLTKLEYFKEKQAATMTPHGTIDLTSVKETPEGVEYRTTDGNTWRVTMERAGDGWRTRGDPEPVK
jgi:hypothetical protein